MRTGNTNSNLTVASNTLSGSGIWSQIQYSDIDLLTPYISGDRKWVMDELEDPSLPLVEDWDKVKTLIDSDDDESVNLGFELLNGHRYPRGIVNKLIIIKGLNKLFKFKKF